MKKIIFASMFLTIAITNIGFAQKIDSTMNVYANNFPQEKMHIHFDKSLYRKGETIWYKMYLMADLQQSPFSKNFYADWYDNNGKLLAHTINPLYQSTSRGQFDIPANYQGNSVHVRAYTQWMLNFDSSFLYEKDISINQPPVAAKKDKTPTEKPSSNIHFFPEGGDWLAGIESRVAFLVNNQLGKPVYAKGVIKNAKGEFVDSFETIHDGMGIISETPSIDNPLIAFWEDSYGNKYNTPLPLPKTSGLALQVQPTTVKTIFFVKNLNEPSYNGEVVHVIAHMNQHVVYKSKISLKEQFLEGEIPTKNLPSGVLQITLFDSKWKPVAERVVFVNNSLPIFTPSLTVTNKGLDKREKNVLEISVDDTTSTNMSVAITDADWYNDTSSNIISQFLLSSDIKGYINNPAFYFTNKSDSVNQFLDLVMLTHGWRKFKWDEVEKGTLPKITYERDTDYLEIKGKVFGHAFNRRNAQNINLILLAKDSTKQLLSLPIDKNGEFLQKGVVFFDTVKAYYQFNKDEKLTDMATVKITNGLFSNYPKKLTNGYNFNLSLPNYLEDTANLLTTSNILAQIDRAEKRAKSHQLAEVTVHTKVKRSVDILDEKYATGMFTGGDAYQFDIINDKFAKSSPDVLWYLETRVGGLQVTGDNINPRVTWHGARPEFFLDEQRVRVEELRSVTMDQVAYIKVFHPPFFGSFGNGAGGAIVVYLRKGEDEQFIAGHGMGYAVIDGYTKYREFYSPDYSTNQAFETDTRTTLYWNPYVLTNAASKTFKVEFYNNDISKSFRVIIEGINSDGKLTRVEKVIE